MKECLLILWKSDGRLSAFTLNWESQLSFLKEGGFRHVQTDHYDIIENSANEIIGIQLSINNKSELKNFLPKNRPSVILDESLSTVSFLLKEGKIHHVAIVQDFCDFFTNSREEGAVLCYQVFRKLA